MKSGAIVPVLFHVAGGATVAVMHGRYDEAPFTTLQDSLGVLSLGSQGRYALVQGIQFGWLDVGGPDPGRFTPLPAVPDGQYVNFAAW